MDENGDHVALGEKYMALRYTARRITVDGYTLEAALQAGAMEFNFGFSNLEKAWYKFKESDQTFYMSLCVGRSTRI